MLWDGVGGRRRSRLSPALPPTPRGMRRGVEQERRLHRKPSPNRRNNGPSAYQSTCDGSSSGHTAANNALQLRRNLANSYTSYRGGGDLKAGGGVVGRAQI